MRICILTQFFKPDITAAAFRLTETAIQLNKKGHDLRIITSHPHKALASDKKDDDSFEESKVLRVHVRPVGAGGLKGYLIHYFSFMFGGIWQGIRLLLSGWRPDVLWVTSPPLFTGLAGVVLSKLFRCPIVLDIRDIWPDSAVSAGQINRDGRAYKIGRKLELWLYARVNALTCVSKPMADYLAKSSPKKVYVIYNGIIPLENFNKSDSIQPRIVYAGNLGRVQGLEMLIDSFQQLLEDDAFNDWEVALIGAGANEIELKNLAHEVPAFAERVKFLPAMSKSYVTRYLAESAILFLNLKPDDVFALTIPSKVFDYMLVGRPILGGIVGEGKDILESTEANICFTPSDSASFSSALREMVTNLDHYAAKACANTELVISNYRREVQTDKLVNVLESVHGDR